MSAPVVPWEAWCAEYVAVRALWFSGVAPEKPWELPDEARRRMATLTSEDVRWLAEAVRHEKRKWFVAVVTQDATSLPEGLFAPLLDAGIDEVNPSYNRSFIAPCMRAFGPRRVNEHLLGVVASGSDFRKAGAVKALYWARVPLTFVGSVPAYTVEHATPESRAAYEALADLRERMRTLLLETFVSNPNVDVRRRIILSLKLDATAYPEALRPLVAQAIEIARGSADEYILRRVELQLGNVDTMLPLPHRATGDGADPAR